MSEEKEIDPVVKPSEVSAEQVDKRLASSKKKAAKKAPKKKASEKSSKVKEPPVVEETRHDLLRRVARSSTEERKAQRFLAQGKTVAYLPGGGLVFSPRAPSRGGHNELQRKFGSLITLVN